MELEILSLPCLRDEGVGLAQDLGGGAGGALRDFENEMLQDAHNWGAASGEVAKMRPCGDPQVVKRAFCRSLLRRLFDCGVLGICQRPRGRVGAFAVSKKPKSIDGKEVKRQRLILDCRQVNMAPPITELGSLASLCETELQVHESFYVGSADIQDCFYACRLPSVMREFFCLGWGLTMSEVFEVTGGIVPQDCWNPGQYGQWSPCLTVLPMGFTWSFYLVQKLHEQSTLHSLSIPRDRLFLDARPAPQLHDKQIGSMPYSDNVHVLGKDGDAVERGLMRACQDLRDMGFSIHEEQPATTHMQTLGAIVDGELGLVHLSSERMWNLILASEYVGRTNKHFSSDSIQRLLGHAMFLCVLCRPGMSIFRSLYDFAGRGLPKCRVWDSARRECCIFSDIIPMLVGNLRRPWSTRVICSDASPSGYGIVERELPTETVRALGRWNERWRFKRLPVSEWRPRDRALGLSSIFDIETAKRPGLILEQSHEYMEDESCEEVPYGIMDPGAWKTAKIGLWIDTSEHITLKEGRAFVLSLRWLSRDKNQRGRRCCVLVDNLALAMCISKGRAHNYHMLRVCQQYSAIAWATDMHVRVRWVPSEVNPADGPSRGSLLPSSSWEEAAGLCGEEGVEEWPLGGDSSPEPECEAQANCESGDIWANSGIIDHLQGTPRASPRISLQEGSEAVQGAEDSASAGPQDQVRWRGDSCYQISSTTAPRTTKSPHQRLVWRRKASVRSSANNT